MPNQIPVLGALRKGLHRGSFMAALPLLVSFATQSEPFCSELKNIRRVYAKSRFVRLFLTATAIAPRMRRFSSDHRSEARSRPVSTWMGDRLGIPGAVAFFFENILIYFPSLPESVGGCVISISHCNVWKTSARV